MENGDVLNELTNAPKTFSVLLVGDADNTVVLKQRLSCVHAFQLHALVSDLKFLGRDAVLLNERTWSRKIDIRRAAAGDELDVRLINQEYGTAANSRSYLAILVMLLSEVGLNAHRTFIPRYIGPRKLTSTCQTAQAGVEVVSISLAAVLCKQSACFASCICRCSLDAGVGRGHLPLESTTGWRLIPGIRQLNLLSPVVPPGRIRRNPITCKRTRGEM